MRQIPRKGPAALQQGRRKRLCGQSRPLLTDMSRNGHQNRRPNTGKTPSNLAFEAFPFRPRSMNLQLYCHSWPDSSLFYVWKQACEFKHVQMRAHANQAGTNMFIKENRKDSFHHVCSITHPMDCFHLFPYRLGYVCRKETTRTSTYFQYSDDPDG